MDENKLELKDGPIWIMRDIKKALQEVYDHYRQVVSRNEYLKDELEKVKSEKYKDEELSKMKEEYKKMKSDFYRGFPISESEEEKIKEWMTKQLKGHPLNTGAIGGRFRYEFIATSVGTIGNVIDGVTEDKLCFRDLY